MLSTIAEIQKGQGLCSGYKWLAGLVSRVCMGVQISRDRPKVVHPVADGKDVARCGVSIGLSCYQWSPGPSISGIDGPPGPLVPE